MNSATLGSDALWVVFERRADRFHHEIWHRRDEGAGAILKSREGQPDDAWPPSPPLQSLHMEARSGEIQTAMLVGMAGNSHWSMSVQADAAKNRLLFDIACRVRQPPAWLGSTYDGVDLHGTTWPPEDFRIAAWSGIEAEEEIAVDVDRASGRISVAAQVVSGGFPQTIRWRYEICLST